MASTWSHAHASRRAKSQPQVNLLAELMAEGSSLRAASKAIGVGYSTAQVYWKRICDDLGSQAQ